VKVTVLGSGTSHGVPMIGCDCAVCRSTDPRDRRSRPSILIDLGGDAPVQTERATRFVLIDTSTDLRMQALTYDVRRVDAIVFTHSHADHILGLDEVRRFNHLSKRPMPCYADARTASDLRRTFSYVFDAGPEKGGGIPNIELTTIDGPLTLGGVDFIPVPLLHGSRPILGYRIGAFAYLTDCSAIPDASWPLLDGVSTLILDALRERPHPTHFNVAQAIAAAERIGAARTYFTHICHDLPHQATNARLPHGIELAYDGLVIEVTD
jgi:phosphoribosyl 1,2-cyclic phosphate phosphodiesterase